MVMIEQTYGQIGRGGSEGGEGGREGREGGDMELSEGREGHVVVT